MSPKFTSTKRKRLSHMGVHLARLVAAAVAISATPAFSQSPYQKDGLEFSISGGIAGDQIKSDASYSGNSGYVVWQDNATDGDGYGISARKISRNLNGAYSPFRVNQDKVGDQENPKVIALSNGGSFIVWQSGKKSAQRIVGRFLKNDGVFAGSELFISPPDQSDCKTPIATETSDGSIIVAWGSDAGGDRMQDVFWQKLNAGGQLVGQPVQANQFTTFHQRNPAIASLAGGSFVVGWISEQQREEVGARSAGTFDLMARVFSASGTATTDENRLNTRKDICAEPTFATLGSEFIGVWSERAARDTENTWDIHAARFNGQAVAVGESQRVNTHRKRDQYEPRLIAGAKNLLVLWTSQGQDGSREGVCGRFLTSIGQPTGSEFQANTTTVAQQMYPSVISDGKDRFVALWSSFVGVNSGFDLVAQRLGLPENEVTAPAAPNVSALSMSRLSVTWPEISGQEVAEYQVWFDTTTKVSSTSLVAVSPNYLPGSTHSVQLAYVLRDGRTSPKSETINGTTWGEDGNVDGLPDDWQSQYFSGTPESWPAGNEDSDGDGATNFREFQAGTNPMDAISVLKQSIESNSQGTRLAWNSQPGFVYQVETSGDFKKWEKFGGPRFAADTRDSVPVNAGTSNTYFRVLRLR